MEITVESKMSEPVTSTQIDRTVSIDSQSRTPLVEMEKSSLHELNDRLAQYFDTIRSIDDSSTAIHGPGDLIDTTAITKNFDQLKAKFQEELNSKGAALERETTQNVLLNAQITQMTGENSFLKKNLTLLKSENKKLEADLLKLDAEISDNQAILLKTQKEIDRLKENGVKNLQQLTQEKEKSEQLETKRRELTERYDKLAVEYAALQDRAKFNEEINREEISLAYTTINEFKEKSQVNESCAYDELSELRSELQEELEFAKRNVIASFKSRLDEAEAELFDAKRDLFDARSEKEVLECGIEKLKIEVDALASNNNFFALKIENMEKEHNSKMRILQENYDHAQQQIDEANEKLHNIMYDYEEVVGNHLALDTEINVYRKMLEGEEKRVGISSRKRNFLEREDAYKFSTPIRGKKMVVDSVDPFNANFIRILNESKKPVSLTSFKLRVSSGDTVSDYKVPKSSIPVGECLILYASDYQGSKEENNVVISELNCFSASRQGDTKIGLLNSKEHVIWEILLTPCSSTPLENSPRPKIFNKRKASMKCMNSPTPSPIPVLRRPSTPFVSNKKIQSDPEEDRKPNCSIS